MVRRGLAADAVAADSLVVVDLLLFDYTADFADQACYLPSNLRMAKRRDPLSYAMRMVPFGYLRRMNYVYIHACIHKTRSVFLTSLSEETVSGISSRHYYLWIPMKHLH